MGSSSAGRCQGGEPTGRTFSCLSCLRSWGALFRVLGLIHRAGGSHGLGDKFWGSWLRVVEGLRVKGLGFVVSGFQGKKV